MRCGRDLRGPQDSASFAAAHYGRALSSGANIPKIRFRIKKLASGLLKPVYAQAELFHILNLMMRSPVPARFSRPFLVSATLCAGLFLAGCGGAKESTAGGPKAPGSPPAAPLKVSFQLDWYPAPEHGGHYQALVKNYYRDGGLDVTIVAGGPGAFGIQKVATGEMQFAMGRCDDIIVAVQRGLPLLIVGTQMQHDPQAIMVHEDSPVKSFRDLDGKSVMGSPGVNWIAFLQGHYGINFNVVPLDYGLARFVADKNFIQQCFISNEPYHVGLHGVKARALLIADGGYDPYRVIFTNKAFARTNPEAVRAFVAASTRGWVEFLHGDAAEARARIGRENPSQTPALMDYSLAAMKRYKLIEGDPANGERAGQLLPTRMEELVRILVQLKILSAPVPLKDFVSFDFVAPELTSVKK